MLIAVALLVVLLTILVVVGILTRGGDDGSPDQPPSGYVVRLG